MPTNGYGSGTEEAANSIEESRQGFKEAVI